MNTFPRPSRRAAGFTLIELLTVITIIAILMAMLFPFIQGAKDSAKSKKADTDVRTIVHAVEQYNVEYGQYPRMSTTTSSGTDDACGADAAGLSTHNSAIFNTLRDIDKDPNAGHEQNPRRQVYMDTHIVSTPSSPRDGFLDGSSAGGATGSFFDPWGTEYCIIVDTNSDNVLDANRFYSDFTSDDRPRNSVGAFSLGKDKKLGKNGNKQYRVSATELSDDHLSWANR